MSSSRSDNTIHTGQAEEKGRWNIERWLSNSFSKSSMDQRLPILLQEARKLQDQLSDWRRDLHRHPEIGYEEHRTAAIVAEHLRTLGLRVQTGIGGTGVVALLEGIEPGPTIALRADMDALPIQDEKDVSYASTVKGKAHLCGHDAHTTMLLGAATLLSSLGALARGNIKFVFQPAEEGFAGAAAMIRDGVLEDPPVDAMTGLHVYPGLQVGEVAVCEGEAFASADFFTIRVYGQAGHAARPHEGIDAIVVAAQMITALQQICSRMVNPLEAAVISIGRIEGGQMISALAQQVEMSGTVRTLSADLRHQMPQMIERVLQGVAAAFGARVELDYRLSYPVVHNDPAMTNFWKQTMEELSDELRWISHAPSTGGEDFAFYAQQVPAVFYRLGTANGHADTMYPLHHPQFDLDESALPYGVATLCAMALELLHRSLPEE